jgi:hypothetical protein
MNLVSMKIDGSADCAPCPVEAYPYGLRICLNHEQCEALGILGPIKAGTQLSVQALVTVVRCAEEAEVDGDDEGTDISLDLQITDLGIGAASMSFSDKADKFYKK